MVCDRNAPTYPHFRACGPITWQFPWQPLKKMAGVPDIIRCWDRQLSRAPPEQLCSRGQRVTEVSQWRTAPLLVRRTALSSAVVAAVVAQLAAVELIKCAFLYFTDFDACSKNELALVPSRGLALQRVSHNAQALPSSGPSCYSVNLHI